MAGGVFVSGGGEANGVVAGGVFVSGESAGCGVVAGGDMRVPGFVAGAIGRGEELIVCCLFLPFLFLLFFPFLFFLFFFFFFFLQLPLGFCRHCFPWPVACGWGTAVAGGIA